MSAFGAKADLDGCRLGRLSLAKMRHSKRLFRPVSNDRERPESAIQARRRERPLPDRKSDIAYEEIIVRRSNWFAYWFS